MIRTIATLILWASTSVIIVDTIRLTGTTNAKYKPPQPVADNTVFDATEWTSTAVGPSSTGGTTGVAVEVGPTDLTATGPKNVTWCGGVVQGSIPQTWSWRATHTFGGAGVTIHNDTFAEWRFLRVHNVEDGIKPREAPEYSNNGSWLLRDSYFTAIRDDCIENDRFEPGAVHDCLFDGVHTFISEQNENVNGNNPIGPDEDRIIQVKRVYVRIYPTNAYDPADDEFAGGGKWFKWQGRGVENHQVQVEDSVFAVGTQPRSGWSNLDIPPQVTWVGSNNFILWLGTGAYGGPKPAGVKFLKGQAAQRKWRAVRNQWLASHGLPSQGSLAADYDPHTATIERIPTSAGGAGDGGCGQPSQ